MTVKVALMGAGGKMGMRITNNIKDLPKYDVAYVEVSEAGINNLKEIGVDVTPEGTALDSAEIVVLALPDRLIGKITEAMVPKLNPGTMIVGLDPAAAYAEVMPIRDDITYFVTHPCHPPLFSGDNDEKKMTDWFGGVYASQHIVCALHHGPEDHYAKGEELAIDMYGNSTGPVIKSHRITVEQMALLEPALVETFSAALLTAVYEGFEQIVEMGVPKEAAWEFLMGHLRTELAIVFGFAGFPFSDGAKLAIEKAKARIFLPEWKDNVFNIENVKKSAKEITDSLK
jgi:D-apionate oxidoisomerase